MAASGYPANKEVGTKMLRDELKTLVEEICVVLIQTMAKKHLQ